MIDDGGRAERYDLRAPVDFAARSIRGTGTVWDMSASGALIEQVFWRAVPGTRLQLDFKFETGEASFELSGEVVRNSDMGGFAVRFPEIESDARARLETLLPRVGTRKA